MKKRLLAIAMSLTMTLSLLPVSAFAGPMDETVENETEILAESVVNSVTEMEVGQSTTDVEQVESQQTTSAVAKVGDTEYATLEAAFEALSAKDHVLTLIDTGAWTYQNVYWQAGDQSGSADTLSAAVEAAHEVASAENIQIICKPETEIKDSNPHIDVTRSISIYANGADFAGDDLSIGTYQAPEKDVTSVDVYDAKNLVVWGQPAEGRADVWNVNFVDCANDGWNFLMYRGEEKGVAKLNLTLTNCKATGYTDSIIHTTADGSINVKGCSFADNCAPINIAHKQSGTMEVVIDGSTFTKCGKVSTNNYFAPVRFVNNNADGTLKVVVTDTTFVDRIGTNGDILIGDGRTGKESHNVALSVQDTEAQVQFQVPGYYNDKGEAIDLSKLITAEISKDKTMDSSLSEQFAVAKIGTKFYPSLAEAITAAKDGQTMELLRSVTVNEPITVKNSITIDGNGNSITRSTDGIILNVVYADGTDVTVQDLTLAGNNGGGLLQWTMEESYKENDSPSATPKLTVKSCTFSSDDGQKTGAGIGLWGHKSGDWFNKAKSEVVIDSCTFDTLSLGIYYNEEAPLLNLKSTVTNNIFKNLSWTGLAGIPANAEIAYNRFEQTCNGAIQYLFNANQTQTNTYIHDNVIDSKTGIQFMPYHLNEGNQNGEKPTVFVTADMLPRIEKNVRNVDTDLVVLVAYRSATDETFKLAEGVSIDLTKNYTQGVAPTIDVEVQAGTGAPSVDEVSPAVKNDIFYLDPDCEILNTDSSSGGGSGSSDNERTYAIITEDDGNGSVTVSADEASAGTRITVTVKPDAGYELDELTVTDAKNKDLKVTKRSETTYTFHMADSKVTVEASFAKDGTVQQPDTRFDDVAKSAWYYKAVEYVAENGIMSGVSAREFAPNAGFSRAMLAQTLYAMSGKPAVKAESIFADVAANAWYADAVNWAAEKGYVSGVGDGKFAPDASVTREQMALILYRYAGSPDASGMAQKEFADSSSVSAYAVDAIRWAVHEGLISGMENNTLAPQGTATRAQVAQILMNFHQKLDK